MRTREEVMKILDTKKTMDRIAYLFDRWQDEKKYEDLRDYADNLRKLVPEVRIIEDEPFTIRFTCRDGPLSMIVSIDEEDPMQLVIEMTD